MHRGCAGLMVKNPDLPLWGPLCWHFAVPSYAPLATVLENRVYVSPDRSDSSVRGVLNFSRGKIVSDDSEAPGVEIGRPGETYHRIRLESDFGKLTAFVTDGHLPYPYGRELAGYEIAALSETLARAKAAGAHVLVEPSTAERRDPALVEFSGRLHRGIVTFEKRPSTRGALWTAVMQFGPI